MPTRKTVGLYDNSLLVCLAVLLSTALYLFLRTYQTPGAPGLKDTRMEAYGGMPPLNSLESQSLEMLQPIPVPPPTPAPPHTTTPPMMAAPTKQQKAPSSQSHHPKNNSIDFVIAQLKSQAM